MEDVALLLSVQAGPDARAPLSIEAPGSVFAEGESNYVTGVGKLKGRLIILLDVSKLLQRQEVKRLEEAAETVAAVK